MKITKVYMIDVDNAGHKETYSFYSTMELAEKALKELLKDIPIEEHEVYSINWEYVDRFHLDKEN